jgi:hypothetical protein
MSAFASDTVPPTASRPTPDRSVIKAGGPAILQPGDRENLAPCCSIGSSIDRLDGLVHCVSILPSKEAAKQGKLVVLASSHPRHNELVVAHTLQEASRPLTAH